MTKNEAESLQLVAQHTTIPVPKVYDLWRNDEPSRPGEEPEMKLFMEYIEGKMLGAVWRNMTTQQKQSVVRQLQGFVEQLRAIPQPPHLRGMICSATGNGNVDNHVWPASLYGPFRNLKEANDWHFATFRRHAERSDIVARGLQELRKKFSDDHPVVFTHGDINWRNVLVKVPDDGGDEVEIAGLIDWEQAGWRPVYWEAFKIQYLLDPRSKSDWKDYAMAGLVAGYEKEIGLEIELMTLCPDVLGGSLVWPE